MGTNDSEMKPTSFKYCKSCIYGTNESTTYVICNYYLVTHQHRWHCPVGMCDKYEKITKDNKKKKLTWSDSLIKVAPKKGIGNNCTGHNYSEV